MLKDKFGQFKVSENQPNTKAIFKNGICKKLHKTYAGWLFLSLRAKFFLKSSSVSLPSTIKGLLSSKLSKPSKLLIS